MKYQLLLIAATSLSLVAISAEPLNLIISKSESHKIYNFNERERIYQDFNINNCNHVTPNLIIDNNRVWEAHMSKGCDTLTRKFEIYQYDRKLIREQYNNPTGIDLQYKLYCDSNYYKHAPAFVTMPLDKRANIKLDWYIPFSPKDYSVCVVEGNYVRIGCRADTIWTRTSVSPSGGVTTESFKYHIEGKDIDHIESKSKAIFNVGLVIYPSSIDSWSEKLCELESNWVETNTSKCSYKIPVASSLRIDADSYQKLRKKAIAEQKRVLFEDRDSLIANAYSKEWKSNAINAFQQRLKPNLEDGKSLSDLSVRIGLKHFITKLTIYYKDGTSRDYIHYNEWELSST